MPGLYFEDFTVGRTFRHEIRRTVTDMDNMLFSSLTYNPAAIHIDHHYAASTEFGRPLMNSIFTLGLVIAAYTGAELWQQLNQRDETVCRTLRAALMLGRP